jgi:hypothetical protein
MDRSYFKKQVSRGDAAIAAKGKGTVVVRCRA